MDLMRLLNAWVAQGEATAEGVRRKRYASSQEPLPYPGHLLKGLVYDPLVAAGELAGGKEVPYLQQDLTRNVSEGYFGLGEPFQESFYAGELDPRYVEKVADVAMNLDMPGIGKGAIGAAAGAPMPDMNQVNINPFPTNHLGNPELFKEVPGSHLGGSTGAKLMQDKAILPNQYVFKAGASPEHVNEELIADDLYRAMQFPHPETYLADIGGVEHRISPFVKGRNYPDLGPMEKNVADQRLRDQFLGDALLANWDVAGGSKWPNIIIEPGTLQPLRIDPGGALRFRAQGGPKGAAFEKNAVPELQSMQKYATANMLPDDLQHQYGQYISPNEVEIMKAVGHDPELEDIMGGRLGALKTQFGKGTAGSLPPTSQLTPPPAPTNFRQPGSNALSSPAPPANAPLQSGVSYGIPTSGPKTAPAPLTPSLPNPAQLPITQGNNNYLSQYGLPPPPPSPAPPMSNVHMGSYTDFLAQHNLQDDNNNWLDYVLNKPPGHHAGQIASGAPPAPAAANPNAQVPFSQGNPDYADWLQKYGAIDIPENAEDWANGWSPGTTMAHGGNFPAPEWHPAKAEYDKLVQYFVKGGEPMPAAQNYAADAIDNPHNWPTTLKSAKVDINTLKAGLAIHPSTGEIIPAGAYIPPQHTTSFNAPSSSYPSPAINTAPFKPTSPPQLLRPGGKFDWEGDFDKLANWIAGTGLNVKDPKEWANVSSLAQTMVEHPGTYTGEATKAGINLRGLGQADPGEIEWTVQNRKRVAAGNAPYAHSRQDVHTEPGWATHQYRSQYNSPLYTGGDEWNRLMNAGYNANLDFDKDIIAAIKPSNPEAVKRQAQLNMLDQLPRHWQQSLAHEPYVPHAVKQSDPDWKQNLPTDLQSAMTPERYANAMAGGFDPRLFYRGAPYPYRRFLDPSGKPGSPYIFQSESPTIAGYYGSKYVYPEALRFGNTEITDVGGRSYGSPTMWLEHMAQGGRQKGLESMQIQNMYDAGGQQTQYLIGNPNQVRSPYAAFDPNRLHEPDLLAARVGGINPFAGQQDEEQPLFPWLPVPTSPPARARPRA